MIRKSLIALLLIMVIAPVYLVGSSLAQEKIVIGKWKALVLFTEGDVKIKDIKTRRSVPAEQGMVLSEGDVIKTGGNSWIEVAFGKQYKNVARVQQNTEASVVAYLPTEISLLKGEIRSLVEKIDKSSSFEIRTPTAVCGARGTGWDTFTDGAETIVDAFERQVYFEPLAPGAVDPIIKAGKRGILKGGSLKVKIGKVPAGKMKDWSSWKRGHKERRSAQNRASGGNNKLSNIQKLVGGFGKGKESRLNKKDSKSIEKRTDLETRSDYHEPKE